MTKAVPIPNERELEEGGRVVYEIDGTNILLLKTDGVTHAIENRCPHRGSPLSGAVLRDGCIQCPWHGLRFNVASGECVTNGQMRLRKFAVKETGSGLAVELPRRDDEKAVAADVRTALVRYGATGQVGWFGTIHPLALHRGAQVVVESAIGLQLGEVLLGNDEPRSTEPQKNALRGEIIRNAKGDDLSNHSRASQKAVQHFAEVENKLRTLGHALVELELTLDQNVMVGWLLSAPEASLGPAAVELATQLGLAQVRFLERHAEESPAAATGRYNGSRVTRDASKKERLMKGPGLRQKNDLDRVWECPGCHHRERSTGIQTSLICPTCARNGGSKPPFMKLVTSPPTAPRRTFQVFSNTPTPVPVVSILGEDTARIPKKQALRPSPTVTAAEGSPESPLVSESEAKVVDSVSGESSAVDSLEKPTDADGADDSSTKN